MLFIIFRRSILLIIALLFIAAEWRVMTKAGEKGWKSLIPFYNVFVSHRIVGMSHIWFVLEVITWIIEFFLEVIPSVPDWVGLVFGIAVGAFTFVSELIHVIKMCDCFGKRGLFKVGMFLVPSVFMAIIAFGKAQYTKPVSSHA